MKITRYKLHSAFRCAGLVVSKGPYRNYSICGLMKAVGMCSGCFNIATKQMCEEEQIEITYEGLPEEIKKGIKDKKKFIFYLLKEVGRWK